MPLSTAQIDFVDNGSQVKGFVGGIGAGKSYVGAYDLLRRAKDGRLYMVVAPTYPMLRDATFRSFRQISRHLGQWIACQRTEFIAQVRTWDGGMAEVLFRSGDDPERLRGPNLSGVWLDEASLMEREVYEVAIGRLREAGELGWLTATFTPKGKQHWTYEVFAQSGTAELVHARTLDNPFLPEEFESSVRSRYTSHMSAQELEGEFVDPVGLMFKREWFAGKIVDAVPAQSVRVRYWDKAGTEGGGAATVGLLMARSPDKRYFIEDVVRGHWSAGRREDVILQTAQDDKERYGRVEYWIEREPGSGGKESAEATIRGLAGFVAHDEHPTGSKEVRAEPFAAQCEAGNVYLLRGPWNAAYLDELTSFPSGKYKDQVDGSSGAFGKLVIIPPPFKYIPPKRDNRYEAYKMPAGTFDH